MSVSKTAGILFAAAVLLSGALCSLGCGHYDAAWRATASVRAAGEMTDTALAQAAGAKHRKCLAKFGPKTMGYASCIRSTKTALEQWTRHAKPAINSALIATATGLTIAEKTGSKDYNWTSALRPAACGLARAVMQWRGLSDQLDALAKKYGPALVALCGKGGTK